MHDSRTLRLLLLCVTLIGAHADLASAQEPVLATTPMLECSGLPCVDVSISGAAHVKMLIDTGNQTSMLDKATAEKLGLPLKPALGPDGKPYPGYSIATAENIRLGSIPLGTIKFLVADFQPDIKSGTFPVADGTLTYTAFHDRILQLNYKEQIIGVSEVLTTDARCPNFCGTVTHPTFGKQGPPIVVTTGFNVNGKPVTVQIDTLYTGTMLIYPTSVEKLGLPAQENAAKKRTFPFTDGGVEMIEGRAASESFGKTILKQDATLYFATPKVHAPDGMFDGTVGHELFTGRVLTFDFHAHRFWMG
jgi:predicted aspartyl protease